MQPRDDSELLRDYCANQSHDAFAELVTRYINLVYSVALRYVGNPHQAEEITHAVFIILAKKAASLRHDKALSSWLFQATHLTANNLIRSEARRHHREQEAYMQSLLDQPDAAVWHDIAPLLDTAVARLNEKDRRAIVLRFYEGRNLHEIGAALGANEESAKKRVARALEKLRRFFAKRGVHSTTAVIAGTMTSHSVQIAPPALAQSVAAAAMAKGATASASTLTLVKGALRAMTMQKIKVIAAMGVLAFFVAGITAVAVEKSAKPNSSVPYRMADDIYRLVDSVDTNRLYVFLTIFSANKDVHPGDICFTIHSTIEGPILYRPSTNGILTMTNFPDNAALRRENPSVTANQPFNSMLILPGFLLMFPENRTFNCSVLTADIDEARHTFAKLNKVGTPGNVGWIGYIQWLLMPTPRVDGVAFVFSRSDAKKATVKIQTPGMTRTYQADATGVITLTLDNKSLPENAQISLSERPLSIGLNYSLRKSALSPFSITVDMGQQIGQ